MHNLRFTLKQPHAHALLLILLAAPALSQSVRVVGRDAIQNAAAVENEAVPERTLKFAPVQSDSTTPISPVTSVPECGPDGSLFLDMLDPKDLKKHTLISFYKEKSQTYSPSAIPDLHDVTIFGFYPSGKIVGFLVRGTKEMSGGAGGPGKSPAGFAWSGYHNYVVEFSPDGSYKDLVELPVSYQLSRLAIFPSGEFLVAGYDQVNSTARLLLLDSSGRISRTLDMPASRIFSSGPYGSIEAARASRELISTLAFTPYGQDILVWRGGNSDPILDVGSGGGVREVQLQEPPGLSFVGMIPANDRWVAHFRVQGVAENSPFSQNAYFYYELRPQDASASAKLVISGDVPQFLACESDGRYTTYKLDKDNKLALFTAN
jgi:hypothetical protein